MDYKYDPELIQEVFKDEYQAFGDDHLLNVCMEHAEWLTEENYAQAVIELGFKYTTADKTANFRKGLGTLKEASYLKRTWSNLKEYPGIDFAVLDLSVILEMPYWIEKGAPCDALPQTIDIAAKELAPHGFEVYDKYSWSMAVGARKIGHISEFLPACDSKTERILAWHCAIYGYRSLEITYM